MGMNYLLAADIGGTNSRFALFSVSEEPCGAVDTAAGSATPGSGPAATGGTDKAAQTAGLELAMVPGSRLSLATPAHGSFSHLLEQLRATESPGGFALLDEHSFKLSGAVMAVPGPVRKGICRAPNIHWPLSAAEAARTLRAESHLINDFAAQGLACLFPSILGLREVMPGQSSPASPQVILGAGTGFGKAIILPAQADSGRFEPEMPACGEQSSNTVFIPYASPARRVAGGPPEGGTTGRQCGFGGGNSVIRLDERILPSEGGHSVFPLVGKEEAAFENFLCRMTGRKEAIGDMIVTGHGLAALFAFHSKSATLLPPPQVTPRLSEQPKTLEWLARFYGRACRNMVLETLALGGVFLSGGMLSHVPGLLGHPAFAEEFRFSETQARLLASVPVWWVSNQDSGLWGAALHGVSLLC